MSFLPSSVITFNKILKMEVGKCLHHNYLKVIDNNKLSHLYCRPKWHKKGFINASSSSRKSTTSALEKFLLVTSDMYRKYEDYRQWLYKGGKYLLLT